MISDARVGFVESRQILFGRLSGSGDDAGRKFMLTGGKVKGESRVRVYLHVFGCHDLDARGLPALDEPPATLSSKLLSGVCTARGDRTRQLLSRGRDDCRRKAQVL